MNVRFSGLMNPVELHGGSASVLEVHNKVLFARMCQSISSQKGECAVEPYSIWSDAGDELNPVQALLWVGDPCNLPWEDRALVGSLRSSVEQLALEDESVRQRIESLSVQLSSAIAQVCFQIEGEYKFALEWELQRYLKTFNFHADYDTEASLFDNLIKFIDFVADVMADKVIVFLNLKIFLGKDELKRLYERVFFRNISILLIESVEDTVSYDHEIKLVVDQDFLEY